MAKKINSNSPWVYFRLGWVYIRNSQRDEGIAHLKQSLALDENNVDVLTKLGEVLLRESNQLEEAEFYLKKAISIDDSLPDALVALGRVHEKKGELDEAIECYEKAIKQPVTNINAYFYLGGIYEKKKDYKRSI